MPSTLSFHAPVELTAASGEGKRPTFSMVAYTGVAMNAGGFYSPVIVELSGVRAGKGKTPIFLNHDPSQIVGQGEAKVDSAGIRVEGSVTNDDGPGQTVVGNAKNGFEWQASIGANITRREFLEAGKKAVVNGREVNGPMVIARESVLQEVSFVPIGADSQTSAAVAASKVSKGKQEMNFEQWLEAKSIDPATLTDEVKTALRAAFDAETKNQGAAPPALTQQNAAGAVTAAADFKSLDSFVSEQKREQARVQEITRIAAQNIARHPLMLDRIDKLARIAIEGKTEPSEFELTVLRETTLLESTGAPPRGGRYSRNEAINDRVIEAAVCDAGKLKTLEKRFDEQTLDAAHRHFPHGLGLQELILMAARENGCSALSVHSNIREVLRAAMPPDLRAEGGFSTLSLPGTLSNIANKFLVESFMGVENSWREFSAIRPVSDFKTITSYSLTGDLTYEKVGAGGELKHGTLGEQSYTNKAETYGKILAITRQDIINDDLGAFTQVPKRLGRGGALKINDVFWTEWMGGEASSFFSTNNKSYDSGTDTALTSAGLTAAMVFWDAKTDPDGKPLGTKPTIMLVPPGQWEPALSLMSSTLVNTGGSNSTAKVPNQNIWASMFKVVKSTYLANSSFTGYSALAWYLIADPADIPAIETCFLGGREQPVIETAEADFDTLGIKMRSYHDFGVKLQSAFAAYKFKGEA